MVHDKQVFVVAPACPIDIHRGPRFSPRESRNNLLPIKRWAVRFFGGWRGIQPDERIAPRPGHHRRQRTMSPIGYARVSTREDRQLLDRQLDALQAAGCERIFNDRMTGIQADRPGLIAWLDHLRTGDVLVVLDLDRLGRRARDLIGLIEDLEKRGIAFKALNSPMDTTTPAGRAFLQIQAAFAEMERNLIRQRGRRPRPRSPWRPATGHDRRATALCPVSDGRPGPEHSTDLLRTGRYARQHALPLSSCRWHAQGTRANADRGRCVNWWKESLPSPTEGRPGEGKAPRPDRSERRF